MNEEPAQGTCPDCGTTVVLRKDGAPRKHACDAIEIRPAEAEPIMTTMARAEPIMTTSTAPRECAADGCSGLPSVGTRCPKHWNGRSHR